MADVTHANELGRPVDLSDVISKFIDIIFGAIKTVMWITAAVVYGWLLFVNITRAQLFEKAFFIGVMALGTVFGYLNVKKFPQTVKLYKEYRDVRREQQKAKKAAGETDADKAKRKAADKANDWPDLDKK